MKFQPPRFYSTSTPTYVDRHYYWGREQYFNGARAHVPISGTMVHLKNVPTPLFVYRWHPFLVVLRRPLSSVTSLVFFPEIVKRASPQLSQHLTHPLVIISPHIKFHHNTVSLQCLLTLNLFFLSFCTLTICLSTLLRSQRSIRWLRGGLSHSISHSRTFNMVCHHKVCVLYRWSERQR